MALKDSIRFGYNGLDFNCPIDRDVFNVHSFYYNNKRRFVDNLRNSKNPNPRYLKMVYEDVTMFSYYLFQLNGSPLLLYPYQDIILNDPHRFKIFRAARQIGKSLSLDVKAAYNLCRDHGFGHNECIISKSLGQAKFQMRRIKHLLGTARFNWHESKGDVDNSSELTVNFYDETDTTYEQEGRPQRIKYSNLLVVVPCTGGALGYDFHDVNLDEIEYWDDIDIRDFINNVIEPTTYATGGSITTYSNPNGNENYIAELESLKLPDGSNKWHTYVFNAYDCPGRSEDDVELMKAGKNRQEIESQLLAIRNLSDKYYFSADEVESSQCDKLTREKDWIADGKETCWFLDVGAKKDQSILTGCYVEPDEKDNRFMHINIFHITKYPSGYPLSRVVGSFDDCQSTDGWHYIKSVREVLEEHQLVNGVNPVFGCDVTGNSGISPLFKSVGIVPVDTVFSGPKKWAMYQRAKYFLEKKLLHVINDRDYDYQMKRMVVKKRGSSSYHSISHEHEDEHDDIPDSVVGCIMLADNPILVEPSIIKI